MTGLHGDELVSRMMTATALRSRVLMNNLANENTPGFKRRDVDFEGRLRDALAQSREAALAVEPRIVEDLVTPPRADGNNVTEELELNALRESQLLFDTYAAILRSNHDLLQRSIGQSA